MYTINKNIIGTYIILFLNPFSSNVHCNLHTFLFLIIKNYNIYILLERVIMCKIKIQFQFKPVSQ